VDSSIPEGGGVIWDAALVFLHFFAKPKHGFSDYLGPSHNIESVVDLGAGTGVVGIAIAKKYAASRILMSEMSQGCRHIMRKSIEYNGVSDRVSECELWWGEMEAKKFKQEVLAGKSPDLIVGTDLIYSAKMF